MFISDGLVSQIWLTGRQLIITDLLVTWIKPQKTLLGKCCLRAFLGIRAALKKQNRKNPTTFV